MSTELGAMWLSSWSLPGLPSGSWKLMLPHKRPESWPQRVAGPIWAPLASPGPWEMCLSFGFD